MILNNKITTKDAEFTDTSYRLSNIKYFPQRW